MLAESGEEAGFLVGQGVKEVKGAHEQVGNSQKEQVVIFLEAPGIPGNGKDADGDDGHTDTGDRLEQQVIVAADQK